MMTALHWRKPSRSNSSAGGNCVEVGIPRDIAYVAVRDTKNRDAGAFTVSPAAFAAFTATVKAGRLDT